MQPIKERKPYPSDVSDSQWVIIQDLATRPPPKKRKSPGGRKPCDPREIWNAINYVLQTGCRWEDLPHDFGCSYSVANKALKQLKYSGRLKKTFERLKANAFKKN